MESLKEDIVSLVLQLLPVKFSLCTVEEPSNLGVGSIENAAKQMLDLEDEICLALGTSFHVTISMDSCSDRTDQLEKNFQQM